MRRDLIIGILVSLLIHAGIAFGSKLFPAHKEVVVAVKEEPKVVEVEIPPLEPDPPEVVENNTDEPPPDLSDIAPPMQTDTPSANIDTPFVQQMQPPPPPNLNRPQGIMTLPVTSNTSAGIGSGMKDLFNLSDLDQKPVPTFQPAPTFPFEMKRAGISGDVLVGFIVDTEGNVRDPYVIKSSQREFESAAIQGVLRWKFRPGRKGGRAVNTRMQVPLGFTLNDD